MQNERLHSVVASMMATFGSDCVFDRIKMIRDRQGTLDVTWRGEEDDEMAKRLLMLWEGQSECLDTADYEVHFPALTTARYIYTDKPKNTLDKPKWIRSCDKR